MIEQQKCGSLCHDLDDTVPNTPSSVLRHSELERMGARLG